MGQLWMLFSGIGCLLLGISAHNFQKRISSPENRHLLFSDSYYAELKNEFEGNLATSPLGIDELLQMITFGASKADITFKELNNVVHLPPHQKFLKSRGPVNELLGQKFKDVELSICNRMYVRKNAKILKSYQTSLKRFFKTRYSQMDFENPELSAKKINNQIALSTRGRIENAISPDAITSRTVAILMNVLYFKGKWKTEFSKKATQPRPFLQNENVKLDVPTMYVESDFKWFNDPEMTATVVEMPYTNEDFSMIIILPNEDQNLKDVENKLHLSALWEKLAGSDKQPLQLNLPKFKIDSSLDLQSTLGKMGIKQLFTKKADLSRMTPTKGVYVSRIEQKIFLEVNEEGSEAAAVSTVFLEDRFGGGADELAVNRPFLAILRYKNLNLFMARITNPLAETA